MENDDLELVRQTLAGRPQAFEALVRRHHVQVLRLCISMLHDPSKGEDAAQETFIKAYKSLERFRGGAAFATWLYRIAANHCLDSLRKESHRRAESLDQLIEREGEKIHGVLGSSADSSSSLEAADLTERLLSGLPEDYRLVLLLRETQGLSYQEIAQTLECSVDAVKARLRRARETLRQGLRHFFSPQTSKE